MRPKRARALFDFTVKSPAMERVDPWVMLGALMAVLQVKGAIGTAEWNETVRLAAEARTRFDEDAADRV